MSPVSHPSQSKSPRRASWAGPPQCGEHVPAGVSSLTPKGQVRRGPEAADLDFGRAHGVADIGRRGHRAGGATAPVGGPATVFLLARPAAFDPLLGSATAIVGQLSHADSSV